MNGGKMDIDAIEETIRKLELNLNKHKQIINKINDNIKGIKQNYKSSNDKELESFERNFSKKFQEEIEYYEENIEILKRARQQYIEMDEAVRNSFKGLNI